MAKFYLSRQLFLFFLALLSISFCATGCVQMGAGAAPSTRPITAKDTVTKVGETEGSDGALGIMGAFQLWPTSTYGAIQEAKDKVGADTLMNVKATNKQYWIILPIYPLITWNTVHVEGTGCNVERSGALKK